MTTPRADQRADGAAVSSSVTPSGGRDPRPPFPLLPLRPAASSRCKSAGYSIERSDFDTLFEVLFRRGYTVVGPTVRDQAIVNDELRADFPIGWTDEQDGRH